MGVNEYNIQFVVQDLFGDDSYLYNTYLTLPFFFVFLTFIVSSYILEWWMLDCQRLFAKTLAIIDNTGTKHGTWINISTKKKQSETMVCTYDRVFIPRYPYTDCI